METNGRTLQEIGEQGRRVYAEKVRALVETEENIGKMVSIDIDTGDFELDPDPIKASRGLRARRPNGVLFGARVGYDAAYAIGAGLRRTPPVCPVPI